MNAFNPRLPLLKVISLINCLPHLTSTSPQPHLNLTSTSPQPHLTQVQRLTQKYFLDKKVLKECQQTPQDKDSLSHFVLRLVMCRNLELRTWFLKYEVMLFRHKFRSLDIKDQTKFLQANGLMGTDCSALTPKEWEENRNSIKSASFSAQKESQPTDVLDRRNYYKVRFQMVPDVIGNRSVFVKGGWAFVPRSKLLKMVSDAFRMRLSKGLATGQAKIAEILQGEEKQRLKPIFDTLARKALGFQNVGTDPKTAREVTDTYLHYLRKQGYSDPKLKETQKYPGSDKFFLMVGYRKANDKDRTCPFANRVHKSNTQRFCVHVKQKVMVQRCWDGLCEGGMHFYQIQDGKIRALKDKVELIIPIQEGGSESKGPTASVGPTATPSDLNATKDKVAPVFDSNTRKPATAAPVGVSPDKAVQ